METAAYRWQGRDLSLALLVQPRASRDEVTGRHGGRIRVRLAAPPVEGKANAALIEFLAEVFGVPKTSVTITAGQSGRRKTVVVRQPRKMPDWLRSVEDDVNPGQ